MSLPVNQYQVLGVPQTASPEDIKHAYRVLARQTHPDIVGNASGEEQFKRFTFAYEILSNPAKRRLHDQEIAAAAPPWSYEAPPPPAPPAYATHDFQPPPPRFARDDAQLHEDWLEFVARRRRRSDEMYRHFLVFQLVSAAAFMVMFIVLWQAHYVTGASIVGFMLTSAHADISIMPVLGMLAGGGIGMVAGFMLALSIGFRHFIVRAGNIVGYLGLIGGYLGALYGHFQF